MISLAGISCDSDSPTEPETTVRATGSYTGQAVLSAATPPGHCFAEGLELLGGSHPLIYGAELAQTGTILEGSFESIDFDQVCTVEGSIDADGDLFFDQVDCTPSCVVFDWTAEPGDSCSLRACPNSTSVSGVAMSDDVIQGQLRIEWDTFDADTDAILGRVITSGSIELTR